VSRRTATVVAQAKINLYLRVLAREASGYHEIETLLCRLELGDEIRVRTGVSGRSLDCTGPAMPKKGLGPMEENLAWRAATAFSSATGWPGGFDIEIDKRIPVGAGLGGGSADAGAVLRALNALAPTPMPLSTLYEMAGTLGADVPFLTQSESSMALAWARGDRLRPLPGLPRRACVLLMPDFSISTRDAYGWLAESPEPAQGAVVYHAGQFASWGSVDAMSYNAFERVVFERHPGLRNAFDKFGENAESVGIASVRMSGSGSALYGLAWTRPAQPGRIPLPVPAGFRSITTATARAAAPVQLSG
jgi:4-diphosphocytidyl-2-C-methyl-D-erythritol kinase